MRRRCRPPASAISWTIPRPSAFACRTDLLYWEDFEVGKRYPTYGRTVTEGDVSLFCAFVGYHVDEEYARRTPYKGRIVPSAFTMSVSTGDTIRTEVEVVSKRETSAGDRGLVVFRDHVLNQRDEVVFQIDKTTLIKRRDGTT